MKLLTATVIIVAMTSSFPANARPNPASKFCGDAFNGKLVPNRSDKQDLLCSLTLANGKQYEIKEWDLFRLFEGHK